MLSALLWHGLSFLLKVQGVKSKVQENVQKERAEKCPLSCLMQLLTSFIGCPAFSKSCALTRNPMR